MDVDRSSEKAHVDDVGKHEEISALVPAAKDGEEKRMNPFDANLLETLHRTTFSPSIFAKVISPSKTDSPDSQRTTPIYSRSSNLRRLRKFCWSIDHIAALNPAQIDETEVVLQECQHDEETEARIQQAIDRFFSQSEIAPSPNHVYYPNSVHITPKMNTNLLFKKTRLDSDMKNHILSPAHVGTSEEKCRTALDSCQTPFSPLVSAKVISPIKDTPDIQRTNSGNSGLRKSYRRRKFRCSFDRITSLSPAQADDGETSSQDSFQQDDTETHIEDELDQFFSSPSYRFNDANIGNDTRRTSFGMQRLSSPEISPIKDGFNDSNCSI